MILKKLFIGCLVFYLATTMYTRHMDSELGGGFLFKLFYSLPLEFNDGRDAVMMQICALSNAELIQLLKTHPTDYAGCAQGQKLEGAAPTDYVVLRFRNKDRYSYGEINCYLSSLPFSIVVHVFLPSRMKEYYNFIFPFPASLETSDHLKPCTIETRWKYFWGGP